MKRLGILLIALAAVACSKADRSTVAPESAAQPEPAPSHEPEHAHAHEHGEFPAAVGAFHDRMAPLWHADAGEARATDTCAAAGDFIAGAEAVASDEVPEAAADPDAWKAAASALLDSTRALQTVCTDTPTEFDAAFVAVHEAFHALVALTQPEKA